MVFLICLVIATKTKTKTNTVLNSNFLNIVAILYTGFCQIVKKSKLIKSTLKLFKTSYFRTEGISTGKARTAAVYSDATLEDNKISYTTSSSKRGL